MTSPDPLEHMHELEGELHALRIQQQSLRAQLMEIESATTQLRDTKSAYRIVGSIMVEAKPDTLAQELAARKQDVSEKLTGLSRHEERLRARFEELQRKTVKGE